MRENTDMKLVFAGLVLIAGTLSANATGIGGTGGHYAPANAPVCPPGQVAKFIGVINGHATWECVAG